VVFWYRQSPDYLVAADTLYTLTFVRPDDPPWVVPGMIGVWLDPRGQLLRFKAVPPSIDESAPVDSSPDWSALLAAAGLDPASLRPVPPTRNPLLDCDERLAWQGAYADRPGVAIRVEAGSYRGRPAYFEIVPPWRKHRDPGSTRGDDLVEDLFFFTILVILLIGGPLLARRSLRLGRGDRRGAFRLVGFIFLIESVWWALNAHHVPTFGELWLLFEFLGSILIVCGLVWLVYIGLEPYARRLWPDGMIAWSRLLTGRIRDPLIGRDLLIGAATGVLIRLWWIGYDALARSLSLEPRAPTLGQLDSLVGVRQAIGQYPDMLNSALFIPIAWLFLVLLARWLLRRQWIAVAAISLICAATFFPYMPNPWVMSAFALVAFGAFLVVLVRFGLVAGVGWALFMFTPRVAVLTLDGSAWYFGRSLLTLLLLAGLALYAFRVASAGRWGAAAANPR
jgi:serine/threonine-protein kinase